MLSAGRIVFSYVVAKLDEDTFGVFRLNGFNTTYPKLITSAGSRMDAKEALKALALEVAQKMGGSIVEADVPQKHLAQFRDWARGMQIVTSKATIVLAG